MSKRALAGGYGPAQKDGRKRSRRKPSQTPLDFALAVMRDETKPDALRAGMAKAVLPYLHTRGEAPKDDAPEREPKSEPLSDLELARRIAHILTRGKDQVEREAATQTLIPPREAGRVPSGSEAGGVLHAPTPPGRSFHSRPPSPEGEGKEKSPPILREDEASRPDPFDPHPGYRWIP